MKRIKLVKRKMLVFIITLILPSIGGFLFSGCQQKNMYHNATIEFPASTYQRTEFNAAIFDIEPFTLNISIPIDWELKTPEANGEVQSDLWSPIGIYKNDLLVGSIGYNTFVYYPEAGDNQIAVYSQLMMGSIVNWNNDYTPIMKSDTLNTATCKIARTQVEPGKAAASPIVYSQGILAHDYELLVYIGMEIDEGVLTKEELDTLVGSISITACTPSGSVSQTPASEKSSQEEVTKPAPSPAPEEIPLEDRVAAITPANGERIREKKAENKDVVGWLIVPGTDIDSVIVQNPTNDNGFYSKHDFAGTPNRDGTYSADCRCDFTIPTREGISQNIALYGHSWDENPDGRLFAQLKRFKEPDFAASHPYIFFSTEAEDMVWEVFAVYDITVNQPYIIPDLPWTLLSEMLDIVYDASIYDYGIRLTESDKILTLSTCSFEPPGRTPLPLDKIPDYRFVVMARLVSPDEACKETVAVTVNDAPLPPDDMPIFYSHHLDAIQYGGTLYDNLARSHSDKIPKIDPANLILVGKVARSGVLRDLQDFDATKLPEGTPLYRLQGYENLLVAKPGEETIVYGYGMK